MQFNRRQVLVGGSVTAALAAVEPTALLKHTARLSVVGLKADYLDRPLGLENAHPRLSWRLESSERNMRQVAYRVLVARSESALRAQRYDLWDTGKVQSRTSVGIRYAGSPLRSRMRCWWQVQVWDAEGKSYATSEPSHWELGLLDPADWNAKWLNVEDDVNREDRIAGLRWIWGKTQRDEVPRQFRFTFDLPMDARGAVLIVGGSRKLTGVWFDGVPLTIDKPLRNVGQGQCPSKILLGPMGAGKHVVAAEVVAGDAASDAYIPMPGGGLAILARLELANQSYMRFTSGEKVKTALTGAADWHSANYNDDAWESACASLIPQEQAWPATPAMQMRKVFAVEKKVIAARLYAAVLGAYEAHINGMRVGDALMAPEISQFRKRVLYQTYDVTSMIVRGKNAIGLAVGDGWFASPLTTGGRYAWGAPRQCLAQLELTFEDGSREVIGTKDDWRIAASPIVSAEIYDGEVYDGRLAQPGWSTPAFDDTHWQTAREGEAPNCTLTAMVSAPLRATQTLRAQSVANRAPGEYIFDFGQNFAGWCRLSIRGLAGSRIELRHAELLTPDGALDRSSLRSAKATDVFFLRGDVHGEILEPHFTYHGFRFVEVTGLPSPPNADTLLGIVIHSDLPDASRLETDSPLINNIWRSVLWTQRSNFFGIPTDSPQRNERLGWMGDAGSFWDSAAFNMDICAFTRRHLQNVRDDQYPTGALPLFAPQQKSIEVLGTSPGWADGAFILSYIAWRRYGDLDVIAQNWDAMNGHLDFVLRENPDFIWRNGRGMDYGDWLSIDAKEDGEPTTPKDLIGTAFWAHSTSLLAEMSDAIARGSDAARLRRLFESIRGAFTSAFVQSDGRVGNGSQTGYVLALGFGLVPTQVESMCARRLADNIRSRGNSLSTGMLGTAYVLDVLADSGYAEIAYSLLLRNAKPSWGHMLECGATTIWERWDNDTSGSTMNSYNHYALGSIVGFLFRRIAGIDAEQPAFEKIRIRAALDPRVRRISAEYESVLGRISTAWSQSENGNISLKVHIPGNATAQIHLPLVAGSRVMEGSRLVSELTDMSVTRLSDQETVIEVGSGSYEFLVRI